MTSAQISALNDEIMERFQKLDRANRKRVLQNLVEVIDATETEDEDARLQAQLEARARLDGMIDEDITDASVTVKEGVRAYMKRKYGAPD